MKYKLTVNELDDIYSAYCYLNFTDEDFDNIDALKNKQILPENSTTWEYQMAYMMDILKSLNEECPYFLYLLYQIYKGHIKLDKYPGVLIFLSIIYFKISVNDIIESDWSFKGYKGVAPGFRIEGGAVTNYFLFFCSSKEKEIPSLIGNWKYKLKMMPPPATEKICKFILDTYSIFKDNDTDIADFRVIYEYYHYYNMSLDNVFLNLVQYLSLSWDDWDYAGKYQDNLHKVKYPLCPSINYLKGMEDFFKYYPLTESGMLKLKNHYNSILILILNKECEDITDSNSGHFAGSFAGQSVDSLREIGNRIKDRINANYNMNLESDI